MSEVLDFHSWTLRQVLVPPGSDSFELKIDMSNLHKFNAEGLEFLQGTGPAKKMDWTFLSATLKKSMDELAGLLVCDEGVILVARMVFQDQTRYGEPAYQLLGPDTPACSAEHVAKLEGPLDPVTLETCLDFYETACLIYDLTTKLRTFCLSCTHFTYQLHAGKFQVALWRSGKSNFALVRDAVRANLLYLRKNAGDIMCLRDLDPEQYGGPPLKRGYEMHPALRQLSKDTVALLKMNPERLVEETGIDVSNRIISGLVVYPSLDGQEACQVEIPIFFGRVFKPSNPLGEGSVYPSMSVSSFDRDGRTFYQKRSAHEFSMAVALEHFAQQTGVRLSPRIVAYGWIKGPFGKAAPFYVNEDAKEGGFDPPNRSPACIEALNAAVALLMMHGITARDLHAGNYVYSPVENRVLFFDFKEWSA